MAVSSSLKPEMVDWSRKKEIHNANLAWKLNTYTTFIYTRTKIHFIKPRQSCVTISQLIWFIWFRPTMRWSNYLTMRCFVMFIYPLSIHTKTTIILFCFKKRWQAFFTLLCCSSCLGHVRSMSKIIKTVLEVSKYF